MQGLTCSTCALLAQGLQQKNLELLTVVRQLSAEQEQGRSRAEEDRAKDRDALEAEKRALYAEREKQQVRSMQETPLFPVWKLVDGNL
jgi:hypothetical protein